MSQQSLIQDLRQIIEQARGHVAATANYELTMMYWHIGERINREVLDNQRAEYGKQIVAQVAQQLQVTYGEKGYEEVLSSLLRLWHKTATERRTYLVKAYIRSGVEELRMDKLKTLLELKFGSVPEGINALGGVPSARQTFKDFQHHLYA